MSDKSFKEKKDIAFNTTPYNLSSDLRELENWNKEEIVKRAKRLIDLAHEVWKLPELSEQVLSKYRAQFDLDDEEEACLTVCVETLKDAPSPDTQELL